MQPRPSSIPPTASEYAGKSQSERPLSPSSLPHLGDAMAGLGLEQRWKKWQRGKLEQEEKVSRKGL